MIKTYDLVAACRHLCHMNPDHPYTSPDAEVYMIKHQVEEAVALINAHFPPGSVDVFGIRAHWAHFEVLFSDATQVVILGAGLDLLAHTEFKEEFRGPISFFEVDLPTTLTIKRVRLLNLPDHVKLDETNITYVGCDFETEDFMAKLLEKGLDLSKPTMFVWLGVSYYLERATVIETLRKIRTAGFPLVEVAMDYAIETGEPTTDAEKKLAQMGEPIKTKFKSLAPDLAKLGFKRLQETSILGAMLNQDLPVYDGDGRHLMLAYFSHDTSND